MKINICLLLKGLLAKFSQKIIGKVSLSLFLILSIFKVAVVHGQALNNYTKDIVMPSPNVASLARYGEIPVNNSTGTPSISVPIHNITYGNLSMPISLSYHAGGVKVGDISSWVGLGWSLNGGSVVSRSVAGNPDDEWNGYIYTRGAWTSSELSEEQSNILLTEETSADPEPDIFSFSAGDYSGKFIIDRNGKVNLIPLQNVKVLVNHVDGLVTLAVNQKITGFTIITPDGTKYIYGIKEGIVQNGIERSIPKSSSGGRSLSSPPYYSSWFLIRVESHDSKYMIDLEYETEKFNQKYAGSTSIIHEVADPSNTTADNLVSKTSINGTFVTSSSYSYNTTELTTARLKSIKTPLSNVTFITSINNRNDLDYTDALTAPKSLSSIEISEGLFKHKYTFYQSYFQASASASYTPSTSVRLKLDSIAQSSVAEYLGSYKFSYISGNVPDRLSKSIDHWGFYNGKNNTASTTNIPPRSINASTLTVSMGDANRESDFSFAKIGTLNKIEYPTGGTTDFEYEANTAIVDPLWLGTPVQQTLYNFGIYSVEPLVPVIQQQITFTQEQIEKGFIDFKVSGSSANIPRAMLEIKRLNGESYEPFFSHIIRNTTGSDYTFRILLSSIINTNSRPLEPNKTYLIKLTYQTPETPGYARIDLQSYKKQDLTLIEKEVGGIRIKTIISKTNTPIVSSITKSFVYKLENGQSSGLVSVYPKYTSTQVYWKKTSTGGSGKVWHLKWNSTADVPLADISGKSIHYSRVEVINSDNTKSVYSYNVSNTFSPYMFPAVPLNHDSNQDELLSERHYNNLGVEVAYTINKRT